MRWLFQVDCGSHSGCQSWREGLGVSPDLTEGVSVGMPAVEIPDASGRPEFAEFPCGGCTLCTRSNKGFQPPQLRVRLCDVPET